MENGYSICFNEWALDKEIKDELGLLLIISSLCAEKGYCWANNKYFSDLLNISEISVSRKIKKLESKNYINIEYEKRGCEITKRIIRLTKMLIDDYQKCKSTINKNVKDNNININNININNKKINKKSFIRPTIEEIEQYCKERNNGINANAFYDFYESKDWYVGKNKMKDWKACIRTWEQRNNKKENNVPKWINENISKKQISKEERYELENILKEFK